MVTQSKPGPPDFDEFPNATDADWRAAAEAGLPPSLSIESLTTETPEGFRLQPLYSAGHGARLQHQHTAPGAPPGVRGGSARARPWLIVEASAQADPLAANDELRAGVAAGGTAISLLPDAATLRCLDPGLAPAALVGRGGCSLAGSEDFEAALAGIPVDSMPLLLQCGVRSLPLAALLLAALRRRGANLGALRGAVGADPLAWLAATGSLPATPAQLYDEQAVWLRWCRQQTPGLDAILLDGGVWHEAGANAVQELACSLANAAAGLREMSARGVAIDEAASGMSLGLAIGGDFLMELAKLRAARLLWSQLVEAFGGAAGAQRLKLHARTSRRNKSALDCWNNMLRSTREALTGAVGGCDSLWIEPFDALLRPANAFSRRHARNQQLILQHEVGLARLQDPAGGSWTLEVLTDWLAGEAWTAFQRIEAAGGLLAALLAGSVQREIAASAQQRAQRNGRREAVQVGSNRFADGSEFAPAAEDAAQQDFAVRRAAQFAARSRREFPALPRLNADQAGFAALLDAAERGATLTQIARALPADTAEPVSVTPLRSQRLARPWEALRARAAAHKARGGSPARVFLALFGEATALQAQVRLVRDFFNVGGFECVTGNARARAQDNVDAAIASGAAAIVICAQQDAWAELVPALCASVRQRCPQVKLYLAGRPEEEQATRLRAAGIDDFLHQGADCLMINEALQQHLGIVR